MNIVASLPFIAFLCLASLTAQATVPTVSISYPPANARLTNAVITLRGLADGKGNTIKQVNVLFNGQPAVANNTTNWSLELALVAGTNSVWVWAVDDAGNQSLAVQRSFVYVVRSPLTVQIEGIGFTAGVINRQQLEVSRRYFIIGVPGRGQTFADWQTVDGTLLTTNATLDFIMQPNLTLVARFVTNLFVSLKGNYAGLFTSTANIAPGSSGHIAITTTAGGIYSGRLRLGTKQIPFTGVFAYANGTASSDVALAEPGLNVHLVLLDPNSGSGHLTGQVYKRATEPWTATISAQMSNYLLNSPVPGRYNLYASPIEASDVRPMPRGFGYGSVLVKNNGDVALTLRLPGAFATISFASALAKDRSFPFFAPLRSGRDLILGWMYFTNQTTADLRGTNITWIRSTNRSGSYPDGFHVANLGIVGARYIAPRDGENVLNWTAGVLRFREGNLGAGFVANLIYQAKSNRFTFLDGNPQDATLTLTRSTGLIQGSFRDRWRAFHGAVLPKSELAPFPLAFGYFRGTDEFGSVLLQPR